MLEIYKQLQNFGHVRPNHSVAKYTTFQIGGLAQFFIEVSETQKLVELLNFLTGEGIPFFILGGGSNTLWQDELYEGVVIKMQNAKLTIEDTLIEAGAGTVFAALVMTAVRNNLAGLEWAMGLPGTVGGAVRGNAGTTWKDLVEGSTAGVLEKIQIWRNGELIDLLPRDCHFGYRESIFKYNQDIVLKAWFRLSKGSSKESMVIMQEIVKRRNGYYPSYPSAGSFFKNVTFENWKGDLAQLPEHFNKARRVPAGWIIEQAGLKGLTVGGCRVSNEHGNFIINFNKGTQADIHLLIEQIKEKVYAKFSIELEPEVCII